MPVLLRGIRGVPMSKSHKSIPKIQFKVKQNKSNKLKREKFIDVKLSLIYQ